MRPPELLELRRAHEGTAEGVIEMEEDGIEAPKPVPVGKPTHRIGLEKFSRFGSC